MKTSLIKTIILLAFLAALPARSFATNNDTIINYIFVDNEIKLVSGDGELYRFAENKDGYKYIYYLFTNCDFLHLDSTDVKANDSHYCLMGDTQPAEWYNSQNFGTARPDVKWTLQYEGVNECVKGHPHRCLHRLSDDEPVILLFNADNNREMKKDTTSVLLYLMSGFSRNGGNDIVVSLNYGGHNGKTPKDFLKETEFSKDDTVLTDLEYVIHHSDRVVIDSIRANNTMIFVEDNPHGQPEVVAVLNGIPISYNKDVNLTIFYRYFDSKGEIKSKLENKALNLHWKKANSPWWVFLVVIAALVALIIAFLKMFRSIMSERKTATNGSQQNGLVDIPNTDGNTQITSENTYSPLVDEPLDPKAEIIELKNKVNNLTTKIASLQSQLETAETKLDNARKEKETAETQARTTLEAEKKKIRDAFEKTITEAIEEKQKAELARDEAEQKAEAKFKQEKEAIEEDRDKQVKAAQEDRDKQVKAAQVEAQKAKDEAARDIEEQKKECANLLQRWFDDKNAITDQFVKNINHLRDLVNRMPSEAFDGNCKKIRSGVNFFADHLTETIASEAWKNLPSGESLVPLRSELCKTIGYGTDTWINLLGRLYSYMSVGQLRDQLSIEGLSFALVSESFTTMQAIMASLGIVVLNCSPGFDSGNDPVTTSLFDNNPAIDRITKWLGSNEAVSEAVVNHGRTVYDFGQLAYFTSEDLYIHKGNVIFYNS